MSDANRRPPRPQLFGIGHADTNRVEAFSDGVLAIVITLLVLEIRLPEEEIESEAALWSALGHLLPIILSWVVSFVSVLVFWVNHHDFFRQLERTDRGLLWLNGLFLLCISFTPFPTALSGEYFGSRPAVVLLSGAMLASAIAFSAMRAYASFSGRLMMPGSDDQQLKLALRRSLIAPVLYAIAFVLAFLVPWAAMLLLAIVPVLFFLRGPSHVAATGDAR